MFRLYTEILDKGNNEHPIHITFPKTGITITISGEGGNRALVVADENGSINLWVDMHLYGGDGRNVAFIAGTSGVHLHNFPSPRLVNRVYNSILWSGAELRNNFFYFTEEKLNKLFEYLYDAGKNGCGWS